MKIFKSSLTRAAMLAVCGFLLVGCGAGGSGTSSDTVVNGNPIPPRPEATANNATIKGVDTNNNQLRDDVEILVASLSTSSSYSGTNLRIAQITEKLATENIQTEAEYLALFKERKCLDEKRTQQERDIFSISDIVYAVINTRERELINASNEAKFSKSVASGVIECN